MRFRLIENKEDLKKKYQRRLLPVEFDRIYDQIPTNLKGHAPYILTQVVSHGHSLEKVLRIVQQAKSKNLPINYDDSLEDIEYLIDQPSKAEQKKIMKAEADIVEETDRYTIIVPKTKEASCLYGAGTKWCTAARSKNEFHAHTDYGVLFYIITKEKDNKKYAVHVPIGFSVGKYKISDDWCAGTMSYFDEMDKEIPFSIIHQLTGWTRNDFKTEKHVLDKIKSLNAKSKQ